MSNTNRSHDGLPVNLDPTVAALLQKDPEQDTSMTTSSIRVVIAQMKLQQARVRGNSDYAAKVMDEAIAEGARDREAWTLLETRIHELEDHIASTSSQTNQQPPPTETDETNAEEEKADGTDAPEPSSQEDPNNNNHSKEQIEQLEKQVQTASDRADTMESILTQCLQDEIGHVQAEQTALKEREEQLRARIRSLQVALQSLSEPSESSSNNTTKSTTTKQELQDAMKDIHEQQSTLLTTHCTICHENTATRAVIPCGHLCLCDACTTRMTKPTGEEDSSSSSQHRQCPLCRGHLLSTLHIYTTK